MNSNPLRSMDFEGEQVEAGSDKITLGEEIASGGEGEIYEIEDNSSDVVKVFYEDDRENKEEKLTAMIRNEPSDPTLDKFDKRSIAWPQAIVRGRSSGPFLGYKMPFIDLSAKVSALEYANENLSWDSSDPEERYQTSLNLAVMVHNVHKEGHGIGDFNHKNIQIEDSIVTLIDTDSYDIKDGDTIHEDTPYHPRYKPPQDREDSATNVQNMDRFSMAVYIFQFLMGGNHPFDVDGGDDAVNGSFEEQTQNNPFPYVDSHGMDVSPSERQRQKYEKLPDEIQNPFERCFSLKAKNTKLENLDDESDERPRPIEWVKVLYNILGKDFELVSDDFGSDDPGEVSGGEETDTPDEEEGDTASTVEEGRPELPGSVYIDSDDGSAGTTTAESKGPELPGSVSLDSDGGDNTNSGDDKGPELPGSVSLDGDGGDDTNSGDNKGPELPDTVSLKYDSGDE